MVVALLFLIPWAVVFIGFPVVSYIINKIKWYKVNRKCPICGSLYKLRYKDVNAYYGGLSIYKKVDCYACSNSSCDNYDECVYVEYDMDVDFLIFTYMLSFLVFLPFFLFLVVL